MGSIARCFAVSRPQVLRRPYHATAWLHKEHEQDSRDNLSTVLGISEDFRHIKKVKIFQPTKASTQSANKSAGLWRLEWDLPSKVLGARWQNPTMGWTSTADPLSQTKLTFTSKEAAVDFAERNGWSYEVFEPTSSGEPNHTEYFPGGGRAGGTFWKGTYGYEEESDDPIPQPKK